MGKDTGLGHAYALKTQQDHIELYAKWAKTYDISFAQTHGYIAPMQIADVVRDKGVMGRVLDVGAGTGLLGQCLQHDGLAIDALDLSPEMLAVARAKTCYQHIIQADLLKPLDIPTAVYDCVVSAGTFTHGHLGPEPFDEMLRVAKSGALFAIGVNQNHFQTQGFEAKLKTLDAHISHLALVQIRLYAPGATGEHADDLGYIATFTKR